MELVDKFDNKRQPLNISRERFEKIAMKYPYPNDIHSELELMDEAEKLTI